MSDERAASRLLQLRSIDRLLLGGVFAYLYAPIFVLVLFSFNASSQTAVWSGFTWSWYVEAWHNTAIVQSLRSSLVVATVTTLLATLFGTAAAIALGRHKFRGKSLFEGLFYLPIVIPEIVVGFASVVFFGLVGWRLGFWSVVACHVAFTISYVVYVVRARLAVLDPTLEQAASDLGATPLRVFSRITLPLLLPGILSAALLVFTLSLDDYVITSFVSGPGGTTLPLQIYSMVRTGVTPEINAISTILLVTSVVLVFLSERLQSGRAGRSTVAMGLLVAIGLGTFAIGGPVRDQNRRVLNVYIWSEYLSEEMVREFEDRYDVTVHLEYYDSNEALLAKLETGVTGYDLVVPSDYMVGILSRLELLERIDRERLENAGNISPRFVGLPFDPDGAYSIPYCWGTTGIGYNREKAGRDITSWNDLWDRRFRNRIGMLNDIREVFAAALKAQGHSVNTTDEEAVADAARQLIAQKPLVRIYDSDTFAENLASGETWLTQGYNGQIAKAAAENPAIRFVVPDEGGTIFVDNLCIPKGAANADLAHLFIDFVLEGRVAAEITKVTWYATANDAARDHLPEEFRTNTIIYPPESLLDRCEFLRQLGADIEIYERHWTRIKS